MCPIKLNLLPMITKESLSDKYMRMANEDLLEVANDKTAYTELANSVAFEELKRRKIPIEEIKAYKPVLRRTSQETKDNCLIDLSIFQKVLYFFILWFPKIRHFYQPEFKQNGYILKDNQANYYSVLGFISFIIAASVGLSNGLIENFLVMWAGCFLAALLFDNLFNKDRQKSNIQKAVEMDELPWGF